MVTLGVDAHKRSHTIVAIDGQGRQLAVKTVATTTKDHLGLLAWAEHSPTQTVKSSAPSRIVVICPGGWSGICSAPGRRSFAYHQN